MTNEELIRLNWIDDVIRSFPRIQDEMDKNHWVIIKTPCEEVAIPGHLRKSFFEWLEKEVQEAKSEFEESYIVRRVE